MIWKLLGRLLAAALTAPTEVTQQPARPSPSSLETEYRELCNNMRHYGNARLTRLTMLFAVSAGLLALLHGRYAVGGPGAVLLKLAGLGLAALFWAVDIDVVFNWRCFRDRAIEVEAALGICQYTVRRERKERPMRRLVSETKATYTFYLLALAFWAAELVLL